LSIYFCFHRADFFLDFVAGPLDYEEIDLEEKGGFTEWNRRRFQQPIYEMETRIFGVVTWLVNRFFYNLKHTHHDILPKP